MVMWPKSGFQPNLTCLNTSDLQITKSVLHGLNWWSNGFHVTWERAVIMIKPLHHWGCKDKSTLTHHCCVQTPVFVIMMYSKVKILEMLKWHALRLTVMYTSSVYAWISCHLATEGWCNLISCTAFKSFPPLSQSVSIEGTSHCLD